MINKHGEGSSSSVAIFAIIVVVLVAIGVAAYSNGFYPFNGRTNTVIIQNKNPVVAPVSPVAPVAPIALVNSSN